MSDNKAILDHVSENSPKMINVSVLSYVIHPWSFHQPDSPQKEIALASLKTCRAHQSRNLWKTSKLN